MQIGGSAAQLVDAPLELGDFRLASLFEHLVGRLPGCVARRVVSCRLHAAELPRVQRFKGQSGKRHSLFDRCSSSRFQVVHRHPKLVSEQSQCLDRGRASARLDP